MVIKNTKPKDKSQLEYGQCMILNKNPVEISIAVRSSITKESLFRFLAALKCTWIFISCSIWLIVK